MIKLNFLKRPFDTLLSGIGIILSFPLWIGLGVLIWLEDRGSIFFTQNRVGKNGCVFKALKFRSMIMDAEKEKGAVQAVEDDPRVTRVGKIMRATAMDEVPQLVNIFKGDMSFVGPRALRPEEREVSDNGISHQLSDYSGYKERHVLKPGLTGMAQVYLPTDAPRHQKFEYDLSYIKKRSFFLDLKLIFLSFWITFRGKWESREDKLKT